jgi:hypothetical protein
LRRESQTGNKLLKGEKKRKEQKSSRRRRTGL